MNTSQIVSLPGNPSFPWLMKVLLALDIRVDFLSSHTSPASPWKHSALGDHVSAQTSDQWGLEIPQLRADPSIGFRFQPGCHVQAVTNLRSFANAQQPTLVLVEPPLDWAKRRFEVAGKSGATMEQFLSAPIAWPDVPAPRWGLPCLEQWALWHWMWVGLAEKYPITFVRTQWIFESPADRITKILKWIGVHRSPQEIVQALEQNPVPLYAEDTAFQTAHGSVLKRMTGELLEKFGASPSSAPSRSCISLFAQTFDSSACDRVQQARLACGSGDLNQAIRILHQGISASAQHPAGFFYESSHLLACEWTSHILGTSDSPTILAQDLVRAIAGFLEREITLPSIQRRLWQCLDEVPAALSATPTPSPSPAPAAVTPKSPPPIGYVEKDYKGFDILTFRSQFWAIARSLGPIDLTQVSDQEIQSWKAKGQCFVDQFTDDLRSRIDRRKAP